MRPVVPHLRGPRTVVRRGQVDLVALEMQSCVVSAAGGALSRT